VRRFYEYYVPTGHCDKYKTDFDGVLCLAIVLEDTAALTILHLLNAVMSRVTIGEIGYQFDNLVIAVGASFEKSIFFRNDTWSIYRNA